MQRRHPAGNPQGYLKVQARGSDFLDFSISDKNGISYDDRNIADSDYFQYAILGIAYLSAPSLREEDGKPVIMAGTQITAMGPTGTVFGSLEGNYFNRYITQITLGQAGYGFLIDRNGAVVSHPDESLIGRAANLFEDARNASIRSLLPFWKI